MSLHTPIEWCDSTINPVMGCDGCELATKGQPDKATCYTWYLHTVLKRAGNAGYADDFFSPKEFAGRLAIAARWTDLTGVERPGKPWLNGRPRHIFISDMGDALSRSISFDFLRREIIDAVTSPEGRRHFWLWLTKRPARMREFDQWLEAGGLPWPDNLMAMTSVTSQATAKRIDDLLQVRARYRGLSCEPLLGQLDLKDWLTKWSTKHMSVNISGALRNKIFAGYQHNDGRVMSRAEAKAALEQLQSKGDRLFPMGTCDSFDPQTGCPGHPKPIGLHWVITGGESGPRATPSHPDWLRSLRDQCVSARVPFFFKQWGDWTQRCLLEVDGQPYGGSADFSEQDPRCEKWPSIKMCSCGGDARTDSGSLPACQCLDGHTLYMQRVGKKLSGRTLDGRAWSEMPTLAAA